MPTTTLAPTPAELRNAQITVEVDPQIAELARLDHALITTERVGESGTAVTVRVASEADYLAIGEMLVDAKRRIKTIQGWFQPLKDALNTAKNELLSKEKDALRFLALFAPAAEKSMLAFRREQDRLRQAAERQARADAEREEQARRQEEIEQLEAAGEDDAAQELAAAPLIAMPAPVSPAIGNVPKVEGLTPTKRWKARIDDPIRLLRWIAQDPERRMHYVDFNTTKLNQAAQAQQASLALPGVVAVEEGGLSARRR